MSEHSLLRERARRCRMLAGGLSNAADQAVLHQLAAEYDAQAAASERLFARIARPPARARELAPQA